MNFDMDLDESLKDIENDLQKVNARIIGFQIRGLKRTKKRLIESMIPPELNEPQPFLELYSKVCDLKDQYDALDIFDKVDLQLDVPPANVPQSNSDVMIKMNFKEKNLFSMGISGQVSSNIDDTSLQGDLTMINPFGQGEHITTAYKYDVFTKSIMYGLDYRGYCRFGRVNMRLFRDQKNLVKQSSVYHSNYGLLLSLSPFYSSKIYDYLSEANVYLKVDYRDLLPYRVPGAPKYQYKTSLTMQNECRPSTRSALGVQLAYDSLDDDIAPTMGLKTVQKCEVSGLLGDCHDVKVESLFSFFLPLSPTYWNSRLALHVATSFGFIRPLTRQGTICYIDRFFCDANKVRGVRPESVGPHTDPKEGGNAHGDCLGGVNYFYSSVSLSTPLPTEILQALQARFHVFYNVGSIFNKSLLCMFGTALSMAVATEEFKKCLVTSYGLGLYFPLGLVGRLEINYLLSKKAFNMSLRIN